MIKLSGSRFTDSGEIGDQKREGTAGDHVSPPSRELNWYCLPRSVRAQLCKMPFFSSTTPGSCRPIGEAMPDSVTISQLSRHVRPSSSDRKNVLSARE